MVFSEDLKRYSCNLLNVCICKIPLECHFTTRNKEFNYSGFFAKGICSQIKKYLFSRFCVIIFIKRIAYRFLANRTINTYQFWDRSFHSRLVRINCGRFTIIDSIKSVCLTHSIPSNNRKVCASVTAKMPYQNRPGTSIRKKQSKDEICGELSGQTSYVLAIFAACFAAQMVYALATYVYRVGQSKWRSHLNNVVLTLFGQLLGAFELSLI